MSVVLQIVSVVSLWAQFWMSNDAFFLALLAFGDRPNRALVAKGWFDALRRIQCSQRAQS